MNDVQTGVGEVPAYISFPCEGPLLSCRGPSDCTFHPSSRNGSVEYWLWAESLCMSHLTAAEALNL